MKVGSTTFAGGVLSKGLWGRVDLQKYQTGLKRARNFQVAVEGGAEKRFGLYLVGKRKLQNKASKLIPWRIANDDSYMLEFGENYVRFIRFGGFVSIPFGHAPISGNMAANVNGIMELATPYLASDLAELKYTFANDIMYITHPKYNERQISRLGLYDWKIESTNFQPHPAAPANVTAEWNNNLQDSDNYNPEPVLTQYRVSATLADGTETLASSVANVDADTGHMRLSVTISWDAVPGATQYTIYKGKAGLFGFIGYTGTLSFRDRNYAPSYDVVPLGSRYTWPAGEFPRVSEFYKQRKVYAASKTNPQRLIFSRPSLMSSFFKSVPLQDDDAIDITLVGRERHTINHMVELKRFIIFTDTAEWVLNTENNAALSAATADPVIETRYGASPNLRPIAIRDRVLFIKNTTGALLDMGYEFTSDAFKADDLSRLSRDLFLNTSIIAWDYSEHPYNLVNVAMSDGRVNLLAYSRDNEVWGWSDFETQGKVIDVACVQELDGTATYMQVERTIAGVTQYFIERQEINYNDNISDMVYVDCALTYKRELSFTNFKFSNVDLVQFNTSGSYDPGDEVQLEFPGVPGYYRVEVIQNADGAIYARPKWLEDEENPLPSYGKSYLCAGTVTGFDHLNGAEVWVLADGKVFKKLEVVNGSIDLPGMFARVHAGLPYFASLATLDLDTQQLAGQYNSRTIGEVTINLRNSQGVWVGSAQSPRDLQQISPRNTGTDMYSPSDVLDGAYEVPTHVAWDRRCGVIVESRDPLPCNILNIVPDILYE